MVTESIRVFRVFPVPPERLYQAWLDSAEHARFTGGDAAIEPTVGGAHSSWDGYIWGRILELEPGRRILQTWRTSEFPDAAEDSRLEILFEPEGRGTRLTLIHSEIPEGQRGRYESGWEDFYFEPMAKYFGAALAAASAAVGAARKAAGRAKKAVEVVVQEAVSGGNGARRSRRPSAAGRRAAKARTKRAVKAAPKRRAKAAAKRVTARAKASGKRGTIRRTASRPKASRGAKAKRVVRRAGRGR